MLKVRSRIDVSGKACEQNPTVVGRALGSKGRKRYLATGAPGVQRIMNKLALHDI